MSTAGRRLCECACVYARALNKSIFSNEDNFFLSLAITRLYRTSDQKTIMFLT